MEAKENNSSKKKILKTYSISNTKVFGEYGWRISTYYTPVKGQSKYFNGSYNADFAVNCSGDCRQPVLAGYYYKKDDAYKYCACDRRFLGSKFKITMPDNHPVHPNESIIVLCVDTGGAVNNKHLDLWAGIGTVGGGYPWIGEWSTRNAKVELQN